MGKHRFGGSWTTDKLERVRKYLAAYTKIFKTNVRAKHLRTTYVDAFAGTGTRVDSPADDAVLGNSLFGLTGDSDVDSFKKGSARIALEVEPPFDEYIFIERNAERAAELESLRTAFAARDIRVERAEANAFLRSWCSQMNWRRNRAVVFLDPYGMQVEWRTIEAIADTEAIDLWWLVPVGIGLNRLLTSGGPPPLEWAEALTRSLGTDEWRSVFYARSDEPMLFPDDVSEHKVAGVDILGRFVLDRLKSAFADVAANPLTLRNSKNTPIYLLCFAAGNPKKARTAVNIAQDILKK
jgi:three-Cys-motif partner protein